MTRLPLHHCYTSLIRTRLRRDWHPSQMQAGLCCQGQFNSTFRNLTPSVSERDSDRQRVPRLRGPGPQAGSDMSNDYLLGIALLEM